MSIESVMSSNHFILCCLLLSPPSIFASIRVSSNGQFFASVAKVLELQLKLQSFQWIFGLISFRIHWLDLLVVQGTFKSLLQHHGSEASTLQCSAFFMVQLSHPYMTTGKPIALTIWTFVGKVMPLLFNMLSRFVMVFLPRSKCLLISWLQSPSAVVLEPKKIKSISISNRNSLFPLFPHLFVMKWWDQMQAEQTTSAKPLWWEHIWWVWGTAWGASVARAELRLDGILDLERLATALQCWHLDTPLLEQATKYEETMWGQK